MACYDCPEWYEKCGVFADKVSEAKRSSWCSLLFREWDKDFNAVVGVISLHNVGLTKLQIVA